jgi:ankyrin repeat protein
MVLSDELMPPPFENAVKENNKKLVCDLLSGARPLPINIRNEASQTGLMISCAHNSVETVKEILVKYQELDNHTIDGTDTIGWTALHHVAKRGSLECAKLLIEHKAEIDATTDKNETPLHIAAQNSCYEIVQLLIEYKADINAKTDRKETALHIASKNNFCKIFQILIENKANIDATTDKNETPLHFAAQNSCYEIVQLLIDYKADINAKTNRKETALHKASKNNFFKIVQILIENKANIDATTDKNETALFLATKHNHPDIVEYLVENSCQLQTKAFSESHLIYNGELRKSGEFTALEAAVHYNFAEIAKFLLHLTRTNGLTEEELNGLLINAAENGSTQIANELLIYGVNVNYQGGTICKSFIF